MKKLAKEIILTDGEIKAIELQLDGKIEVWTTDEETQKNLMSVIDKAESLVDELDAIDEIGDDLIAWYYDLYKSQNK